MEPLTASSLLRWATLVFFVIWTHKIRCAGGVQNVEAINQQKNITKLLNSLLDRYDKYLRPGFGGPPLKVTTNILIRSMGPISEQDMMYSMDCYFRQSWSDARLEFNSTDLDEVRPSIKMLKEIWKPDTFFFNGHDSYLHTITYPNKLFRIKRNGVMLYSQRLTIRANCPMYLGKYPMDTQYCPILIGSYGYSKEDLMYIWNSDSQVNAVDGLAMSQFSLQNITVSDGSKITPYGTASVLKVTFILKRMIGYYILQVYLPCYLIVIISWVSFWINREATPARVTLGITTLLTTCTIGLTGRVGIPKVSYSTALDIFLLLCFGYVFAALVEYAGVNYFTKTGPVVAQEPEEEVDPAEVNSPLLKNGKGKRLVAGVNGHTLRNIRLHEHDSCFRMFVQCLKGSARYREYNNKRRSLTVSVSKIDSISKFCFPFTFIVLNIIYWTGFLFYFEY